MSPIMKCVICETTTDVNLVDGEKVCMDNSCRRTAFCIPEYESSDDDLSGDESDESDDESDDEDDAKCIWCKEKAVIALKEGGVLELEYWNRHCNWDEDSYQVLACRECGEAFLTDYPNHENRPFSV